MSRQGKRRPPRRLPGAGPDVDSLGSVQAEVDEGARLLRPHYPEAGDGELHSRAVGLLRRRYERGRWPTAEEIEAGKPPPDKETSHEQN